jgi:hypothetical protein
MVLGKKKKKHKFKKTPFHVSFLGNELNKFQFGTVQFTMTLMKPKVALPKRVPMNHYL